MEKTAMQKHLEWLKGRMVITPQMESQLLEEEKQQIIDAYCHNNIDDVILKDFANKYYNQIFNK